MGYRVEERTQVQDKGEAARVFAARVDGESIRLVSTVTVPAGEWVAFEVQLADGEPFLEGMGRCETTDADGEMFRVRLGDLQFDAMNELMFERMQLELESLATGEHTGEIDLSAIDGTRAPTPASTPERPPPAIPVPVATPSYRPPPPLASGLVAPSSPPPSSTTESTTDSKSESASDSKNESASDSQSESLTPPANGPRAMPPPLAAPSPSMAPAVLRPPTPDATPSWRPPAPARTPSLDGTSSFVKEDKSSNGEDEADTIDARLEPLLLAMRRAGAARQVSEARALALELGVSALEKIFGDGS